MAHNETDMADEANGTRNNYLNNVLEGYQANMAKKVSNHTLVVLHDCLLYRCKGQVHVVLAKAIMVILIKVLSKACHLALFSNKKLSNYLNSNGLGRRARWITTQVTKMQRCSGMVRSN